MLMLPVHINEKMTNKIDIRQKALLLDHLLSCNSNRIDNAVLSDGKLKTFYSINYCSKCSFKSIIIIKKTV